MHGAHMQKENSSLERFAFAFAQRVDFSLGVCMSSDSSLLCEGDRSPPEDLQGFPRRGWGPSQGV